MEEIIVKLVPFPKKKNSKTQVHKGCMHRPDVAQIRGKLGLLTGHVELTCQI